MGSTTENSDPYLYTGTSVLKNLRGLTDTRNFSLALKHAKLIDALQS
jgi:hypothetical protein